MKIFSTIAAMILLGAASMNAAERPDTIRLWPDGAPNAFETGFTAEHIKDNNLVLEPLLIVYPAENPNGQAIIACPGGGYRHLAKFHEGMDMAKWFNDLGITYGVLLYRMPEEHADVPLSDAQQAMRLLRGNAQKYGISSIGIMGASAGGHLASTVATHFSDDAERPDFQILFYPVVSPDPDITNAITRRCLLGETPDPLLNWDLSNENKVTPQTPQAFIMLSVDDNVVHPDNSIRYYQALRRAGVPVALNVYPTGGHGWGFKDSFPYKQAWTASLATWLHEINKK